MRPGLGLKAAVEPMLRMTPAAPLAHVRDERLGGQQQRLHVDGEDAVELGLLDLHQRLVAMRGPGVVDHDVDPAERLDRALCGALDVLALRDVGGQRDRAPTEAPGRSLGDVGLEVEARHARALAGEDLRDAVAEPLPCARHERGLSFQSHRPSLPTLAGSARLLPLLDERVVHARARGSQPDGR